MELKKNEKYDLERKKPLFFGVGLILSLSLVISAFEYKTEIEPIIGEVVDIIDFDEPIVIPFTKHKEPEPPKPKVQKKVIRTVEATKDLEETVKEIEVEIDQEFDETEIIDYEIGNVEEEVTDKIFIFSETPASFLGDGSILSFMSKNIKYPRKAKRLGAEGTVIVNFVIEKDGTVQNTKILRSVGFGCDEEAVRVIKMLKFSPGKQRGNPVRVQMTVPINFTLQH